MGNSRRAATPTSHALTAGVVARLHEIEGEAMKFLVLGAGAIGTYVGGSLAARGESVTFVEQPAVAEIIARQGLVVHRGSYTTSVRDIDLRTSTADALAAGPYDACVFALKSFDTESAVDGLVATGHEVPPILSLQNGVDNEPTIASKLGADGVIAGTVCSAIGKPGVGEVVEEKHRGIGIALGQRPRQHNERRHRQQHDRQLQRREWLQDVLHRGPNPGRCGLASTCRLG